jgi:molecular chaperone DnaK (HSP70)
MSKIIVTVVAIDLGTTSSGYAFSFQNDKTHIFMNRNWGDELSCQSHKTPTSVLTGPKDEFVAFGYDAIAMYRNFVGEEKNDYNLFKHFKMILHKSSEWDENVKVASITGTERPALHVFAVFIKALKDHCLAAISAAMVNSQEDMILWVLTVPAIWTDTAKDFMREAAFKAGLIKEKNSDKLILALEPEAAALFCKQIPVRTFGNTGEFNKVRNRTEVPCHRCRWWNHRYHCPQSSGRLKTP